MIKLPDSLQAWPGSDFVDVFKKEVGQIDGRLLPLQQGLSQGSLANESQFDVVVLRAVEDEQAIGVKAGIFYTSVIAGCACTDDPTPENELSEYCEIQFDIDKKTAETSIQLL